MNLVFAGCKEGYCVLELTFKWIYTACVVVNFCWSELSTVPG